MAAPGERKRTFLRGSGFLLSLIGAWDRIAAEPGPQPAQQGFVMFKETKFIAVLERPQQRRRGLEGTYAVKGNRILLTTVLIDTAPEQGVLGEGEFTIAGDLLTIAWLHPPEPTPQYVETFRRRAQQSDGAVLPPTAIYESDASQTTSR